MLSTNVQEDTISCHMNITKTYFPQVAILNLCLTATPRKIMYQITVKIVETQKACGKNIFPRFLEAKRAPQIREKIWSFALGKFRPCH